MLKSRPWISFHGHRDGMFKVCWKVTFYRIILNFFQNIRKYAQNGTRAARSHKNITPPFYFLNPEGQVHRCSTLADITYFPSTTILWGTKKHPLYTYNTYRVCQKNTRSQENLLGRGGKLNISPISAWFSKNLLKFQFLWGAPPPRRTHLWV